MEERVEDLNESIENDVLNSKVELKQDEEVHINTGSLLRKNFSNRFKDIKIKYKKDPKKFMVVVLGLFACFSALIGSSYAYLTYVSKTNSTTTIRAGQLALNLENETNAIYLNNALPKTDEEGLAREEEYEFTIKNEGTINANYKITLDNTCTTSKTYTINEEVITPDLCIPNEYIKVAIKEGTNDYKIIEKDENDNIIIDADTVQANKSKTYKMKIWLAYETPNSYNGQGTRYIIYSAKLGLTYEQGTKSGLPSLDKSGANEPVLSENMLAVYYDETDEVWKKADSNNANSDYKWYDYDDKMWANSVTVSSENRNTYKNADLGTTIPMEDILTMQVWIPRYKYKIFNYNANGETYVDPQEIDIKFENEKETTGEVSCVDNIQGENDGTSDTCKLKSNNETCTDSICNNKYYIHPAFTFGDDELEGIWVGKFELTGTINNITTKPNESSLRSQTVSSFSTNIMAMNDTNNMYGLTTNDDTHMIKNMEWGAVAYFTQSKYGMCDNGECSEININNSSDFYTGRSGGNVGGSTPINGTYLDQTSTTRNNTYGFYTYDGYLLNYNTNTKSSTKDISKVASTTKNIYGIYDMSGGSNEYVMSNMVSPDGTTMMSGYTITSNSGYTGIIYDSGNYTSYTGIAYPNSKYYDKYSFGTNNTQKIRAKLGDGIKEVGTSSSKSWHGDYASLADSYRPWFLRGGSYSVDSRAGVFSSQGESGFAHSSYSARLVLAVS